MREVGDHEDTARTAALPPHSLDTLQRWWKLAGCSENGTHYPGSEPPGLGKRPAVSLWENAVIRTFLLSTSRKFPHKLNQHVVQHIVGFFSVEAIRGWQGMSAGRVWRDMLEGKERAHRAARHLRGHPAPDSDERDDAKTKIEQLKLRKARAVEVEDYDSAKHLKSQIEALDSTRQTVQTKALSVEGGDEEDDREEWELPQAAAFVQAFGPYSGCFSHRDIEEEENPDNYRQLFAKHRQVDKGCFVGEGLAAMSSGHVKPVRELRVGDELRCPSAAGA